MDGCQSPSSIFLIKTFIGSNIVALGSGTPYMYSYYAPQLLSRCDISIKYSSNIALALNIGSSLLGMFAGVLVDINPRIATLVGSISTLLAYTILYICYRNAISSMSLIFLALVLIGYGAISGLYSGMKVCTTNFPNHRGIASACPVSLYGLSGLLFSLICRNIFKGDIQAVFLFLLIACSLMSFIGVFTLDVFDYNYIKDLESKYILTETISSQPELAATLSNSAEDEGSFLKYHMSDFTESFNDHAAHHYRTESKSRHSTKIARFSGELTRNSRVGSSKSIINEIADGVHSLLNKSPGSSVSSVSELFSNNTHSKNNNLVVNFKEIVKNDQNIWDCVKSSKFLLYYVIIAILQGIGQTYIYSIGFIVQAQVNSMSSDNSNNNKPIDTATIQATQVAIVSISSFVGRLSSGFFSDVLKKRLNSQRIWTTFTASTLTIIGSIIIIRVDPTKHSLANVYKSSIIFGYAFGAMFGSFPSIIADSFGTKNFSKIWGVCTTGCLITIKWYSAILAQNLSNYTQPNESTCKAGVKCYEYTFYVIKLNAFLSCVLILFIIGNTYHKAKTN